MLKKLTAIFLLSIAGYGALEAWPLIAGPRLSITSPAEGAVVPGGIVAVAGNAARAANLTLDGALVAHEENGDFATTLTFPHGTSILTFAATDQFGKRRTATRTIYVP